MRRQLRWKGSLASLLQGRVRVATLAGPRRSALRPAGSQGGAHPAIATQRGRAADLAYVDAAQPCHVSVPGLRPCVHEQGQDYPPRLPFGKG